jgi:hypothetical protein
MDAANFVRDLGTSLTTTSTCRHIPDDCNKATLNYHLTSICFKNIVKYIAAYVSEGHQLAMQDTLSSPVSSDTWLWKSPVPRRIIATLLSISVTFPQSEF